MALAGLGLPHGLRGQDAAARPTFSVRDAAAIGVAAALYAAPRLFEIWPGPSACGPCDRQTVPGFDRWSIVEPRTGWGQASTGLFLALTGAAGAELSGTNGGAPHAVALVESGALALGVAEMLKALTGRRRPILYTSAAQGVVADKNSRRSLPSGHTSAAFAVAMSYWLSRRALHDERPGVPGWLAFMAAAGVGVMRVTAGEHFPSDVVVGAALGVGTAMLVHVVRF